MLLADQTLSTYRASNDKWRTCKGLPKPLLAHLLVKLIFPCSFDPEQNDKNTQFCKTNVREKLFNKSHFFQVAHLTLRPGYDTVVQEPLDSSLIPGDEHYCIGNIVMEKWLMNNDFIIAWVMGCARITY